MGKSEFKIAADFVIADIKEYGHKTFVDSSYYCAYIHLFREINSKFDEKKFDDYILKRI